MIEGTAEIEVIVVRVVTHVRVVMVLAVIVATVLVQEAIVRVVTATVPVPKVTARRASALLKEPARSRETALRQKVVKSEPPAKSARPVKSAPPVRSGRAVKRPRMTVRSSPRRSGRKLVSVDARSEQQLELALATSEGELERVVLRDTPARALMKRSLRLGVPLFSVHRASLGVAGGPARKSARRLGVHRPSVGRTTLRRRPGSSSFKEPVR